MAEEDNNNEEAEESKAEEKPAGNKKKLILLILLGLLLVGVSVGGTLAVLMLVGDKEVAKEGEQLTDDEAEPTPEPLKPAIYYPIKPPIIVTFDARGRQRYMQAEITLMTREDDVVAAVETHMPMIRNALVLLIGGQLYEEVQTAEGKELLRVQCLQELQRLLEQEIGKSGIEQVLFTNIVMQ